MRLLKWLFQPAYLVLIIVLVALYVNREAVFPEDVAESLEAEALTARVDSLVERFRADSEVAVAPLQQDEVESVSLSEDTAVSPAEDAVVSPVEDALVSPAEDAVASPTEVAVASMPASSESGDPQQPGSVAGQATAEPTDELAEESQPMAQSMAEAEPVIETVNDEAPGHTEQATAQSDSSVIDEAVAVEQPVAQSSVAADTLVSPEPASSEPAGAPSPLAVWRAARSAVWQGDLNSAVMQYRQLIAVQPDNYDAYGEMGNVLLAQANVAAAVEAYVAAARLIRQSGNTEMAYRLAAVVGRLDPQQGRALHDEFSR